MSHHVTFEKGATLGERYELFEEIGEGSFGRIFRARQLDVDRDVAIKVLPPHFSSKDNVVERFRREARLASRLHHPNTITIYEYGRHDDLFFIAMEYLRGEDLADRLVSQRTLELSTALHIAQQTLHSLHEAHDKGIVHRDLKPENIFLTELAGDDDFVKILDFGIAKLATQHPQSMSEDGRALTIQGNTVGTPIYMSPEQAAGEDVDAASDLYALGVILYEMVNGSPPFAHKRPVRTMRAHLFDPVPPFARQSLRGSVFDSIVRKALAKDPEDRFGDAGEFLDELSRQDLSSLLIDDQGEQHGPASASDDSIPFDSICDTQADEQSPPPDGFSSDTTSATSSIITVLDEPSENDVIVLTKRKVPDDAGNTPSTSLNPSSPSISDEGSTARQSDAEVNTAADATPSEPVDPRSDWKWSEEITTTDASGSQILTDFGRANPRRGVVAFAAIVILAAVVLLTIAVIGGFP